jgi:anthranilate phosphoribosyltransferase
VKPEEIYGGNTKEEAVGIFDRVLNNTASEAQKNVVIANAAFAIQVLEGGKKEIDECVAIARESVESGRALEVFKKYVEINR